MKSWRRRQSGGAPGQNTSAPEINSRRENLRLPVCIPRKDTVSTDRNGHSEVLLAEYGSFSMLLMGDAGAEAEEEISEKWEQGKQVQVLKAGHHGSSASSCGLFLDYREACPGSPVLREGKRPTDIPIRRY